MNNLQKQETYTGNFILSFAGIYLVCFFIASCIFAFKFFETARDKYWVMFVVWIFFFVAFTNGMNYFILTDKKLIVKNPIWFWKKLEFDLNKIEQISIVQPFRSPISLEIVTINSKRLIRASSLRNRTWKKLKQGLLDKNIIVNDKVGWD